MVLLVLGVVTLLVAAAGYGYARFDLRSSTGTATVEPTVAPTSARPAAPRPTATVTPPTKASPKLTFPQDGPGTFTFAGGSGPLLGTAGTRQTYRVAVEKGSPVKADDFAALVDATLGDPRSWIASKSLRLQRVKADQGSTFTVYLATPGTALTMCLAGGVDIRIDGTPYTSCRAGSHVIINMARFVNGIPHYGARLDVYRQYAINHEVGHALGHGHELCTAKGRLAPVMQQQTLDMLGCKPNAWPYVDGKRYSGPAGSV